MRSASPRTSSSAPRWKESLPSSSSLRMWLAQPSSPSGTAHRMSSPKLPLRGRRATATCHWPSARLGGLGCSSPPLCSPPSSSAHPRWCRWPRAPSSATRASTCLRWWRCYWCWWTVRSTSSRASSSPPSTSRTSSSRSSASGTSGATSRGRGSCWTRTCRCPGPRSVGSSPIQRARGWRRGYSTRRPTARRATRWRRGGGGAWSTSTRRPTSPASRSPRTCRGRGSWRRTALCTRACSPARWTRVPWPST
mmetsp:Transcript_27149/g.59327  ORF Transcript_27149/g.59327 Transcript_27149/m.59327 type:complete len:251 (-) Transcript_27149:269-1021(-)